MKTPEEIQSFIEAKETELKALVESHNNTAAQLQQIMSQNQARANELQGEIKAYKSLLEETKIE